MMVLENLDEYQKAIEKFRVPAYNEQACVMGLLSEAGEVAGVFQKMIRGDFSPDVAATKLHKELGDILWHVAQVAADNGWKLSDVATENYNKLESRQIRNQILGSGDNR
jgi:NTP pyrophosphatase (non-canonical NTP hydrolase)